MKTKSTPTTIDQYLANVKLDQRAALEKLRKTIKVAAPDAEECINYGVAAFKVNGKVIAGFGASAKHCSYYPMSGHTVAAFKDDLKGFETSKGAIQFQPEKPLPAALVKKLIKARIADTDTTKKPNNADSQTDPEVVAFLRALKHPLKKDIESVRKIILGVSPEIHEGIKWNAPSFRISEYFATFFLRSEDRVQLIFHRGAKAKDNAKKLQIADSKGLIEWLGTDRCRVTLGVGKQIKANRAAFERIIREWIAQM
jgi:uncharacterized protein YdhG (YjbR/CyaY superfamily)